MCISPAAQPLMTYAYRAVHAVFDNLFVHDCHNYDGAAVFYYTAERELEPLKLHRKSVLDDKRPPP